MAKVEKVSCISCGESKYSTRDFYKSSSKLYTLNGRLPYCKSCVQNRYDELLTDYNGESSDAFRHMLLNFDVFYDDELYNKCTIEFGTSFIGEYFRQVNGTKERKNKTSRSNTLQSNGTKDVMLEDGVISQALMLEWGRGRDFQDYVVLENRYKELIKQFPSETSEEKYIIKDICKLELDIEECRRNGKPDKIATLENVKSKKMHDLDAIPSERKLSAKDDDIKIFGCGVKVYETSNPIPTLSPKFKDVDYLTSYWGRSIVKPMAKINGLANGEYSLERGMDDIEFTPEYLEALGEVDE
ncbi:MAG: hypothetical protein ACRCWM_07525 [Sarcina sp.]